MSELSINSGNSLVGIISSRLEFIVSGKELYQDLWEGERSGLCYYFSGLKLINFSFLWWFSQTLSQHLFVNMHCKTILVCVAICLFSIPHVASFGPITITLGTTALALSGTQVALGVAALAGLVIVKEKIAVAEISRQRGYDIFFE